MHTLWGGKVNRPLAMALAVAWERKFGYPLEIYVGNNSIMLMLPLQFVSWEANRFLHQGGLNEESIYWLNAADPASPCGLKLPGMDEDLPATCQPILSCFTGAG